MLNRIITFTGDGFELEADPRHSEMIVEQLGVTGSGGITTAGCQNEEVESPEQEEKLPLGDVTLFRGVAARARSARYVLCVKGSLPGDELTIGERIGEDIEDLQIPCWKTRVVWEFPNQEHQEAMDIYVDANSAGCRRTRKSTSGGCAMLGRHCTKAWSSTHSIIAKVIR